MFALIKNFMNLRVLQIEQCGGFYVARSKEALKNNRNFPVTVKIKEKLYYRGIGVRPNKYAQNGIIVPYLPGTEITLKSFFLQIVIH